MPTTEPTPERAPSEGTAPALRTGARTAAVLPLLVGVAVVVFVLDQLAKAWAVANLPEAQPRHVIGDLLIFQRVENPGAAFSIASGSTWLFSVIAVLVVGFLLWFARRIRSLGWSVLFGLLLGGTAGNLTDRLTRPPGFGVGHVVDFLQIPLLPAIFNLADTAIVSSMCLFVLLTLTGVGLDGRRAERPGRHQRADGSPSDA